MTDFAAAQRRILARRAANEASQTAARQASETARAQTISSLHLPPALRVLLQNTLSFIPSNLNGTRPAFRVGQVDAELLDEELLSLLKQQAGEGLKFFGGHIKDDWDAEILLALRAAIWKLGMWDHAASYGARLQGLHYADARGGNQQQAKAWQRLAHGVFTVGGRYSWARWEDWLSERENGLGEPSTLVQRLARATNMLGTVHSVAAFTSFLVFLYNGRYRSLTDRLLGMRLVPASSQTSREVSFEYLNRQLVWHAFTEFLLFLLPLVGIGRWRRWIARAWKKVPSTFSRAGDQFEEARLGELGFLPERTCAICYSASNVTTAQAGMQSGGVVGSAATDVTNPYETIPCGCVYCFVCIAQRIEAEEGEGWTCLRCGENVKECRPWAGDVVEAKSRSARSSGGSGSRPASRKSVAFADTDDEKEEGEDEDEAGFGKKRQMSVVEPMPVDDLSAMVPNEEGDTELGNSEEWANVDQNEGIIVDHENE